MSTSKELKASLERELELLQKARDELKLQLNLAKKEARDEWTKLEATYQRVEGELKSAANNAKEPLKELSGSAKGLLDELKRGYSRVKAELRDLK